jgi:hypothetical protein
MKKYDTTFLVLGILLSFIPIYSFTGLVYLEYTNTELNGIELFNLYHSTIMLNLFDGYYANGLASFIPGIVSGLLLLLSLLNDKKLKSLKILFLLICFVFTSLGLFRFM